MVECSNITWRVVENSLSKRMIDGSLTHFFDGAPKTISEKTQFVNKHLEKLHSIKDYEQYVKIKTRALKKFVGLDVSDDDDNDVYRFNTATKKNLKTKKSVNKVTADKIKGSKENKKKSKHKNTTKNKSDIPQNGKNDVDLKDINNSAVQSISNGEKNDVDSKDVNNSVVQSTSNGEENDLIVDDYLIEDPVDEIQDIVHSELLNDSITENGNNELIEDDTIDIPQSQNIDTIIRKEKPVVKITSTEVVKPKYTIVRDPQVIINITNNLLKNQNTSEELFDNSDSDRKSEDSTNSIINGENMTKREAISSEDRKSIMRQIYSSTSSEDEELESSLNKISKHTNRFNIDIETSNSPMRIDNEIFQVNLNVQSDDDCDMTMNGENIAERTRRTSDIDNNKSICSLSSEKAALEYVLQHMSHLKSLEEKHMFETECLNENYIHVRNELRDDSEEDSDSASQSEISHRRPMTLSDLVEMNNLVPMENKESTLTLDDLSDNDELFVMEIPKSVIDQQQLVGQEMEIRNHSLIIGGMKYKLHRRENDTRTCILRENNEEMSFKAVNIKPTESFVVKQRSLPKVIKSCSSQIFNNTNGRAPFPNNLKIRNPVENTNKKLKRYKKKYSRMTKRMFTEKQN